MEGVSVARLKKGLSKIKKDLSQTVGPVWSLNRAQVVSKLTGLGYSYDQDSKTLKITPSKAMRRKPSSVNI